MDETFCIIYSEDEDISAAKSPGCQEEVGDKIRVHNSTADMVRFGNTAVLLIQ